MGGRGKGDEGRGGEKSGVLCWCQKVLQCCAQVVAILFIPLFIFACPVWGVVIVYACRCKYMKTFVLVHMGVVMGVKVVLRLVLGLECSVLLKCQN